MLKPKNLVRAPASLPGSTQSDWSYGDGGASPFALGIFAAEHVNLSKAAPRRAPQPMTPDFGATTHSFPVFNLRAGYAWSPDWSLVASGGVDLAEGVGDPKLGVLTSLPLSGRLSSVLGLSFALPLSEASRDVSRLMAVTLSWAPLYQGKRFFAGASPFVTGNFYAPEISSASGATLQPSTIKERTSAGGALFAGYDLTSYFSASGGIGLSGAYYTDSSVGWRTEATLARATFNHAGLSASGAFSLTGSASGEAAVPSSPVVTFRLHYVFGETRTLGILRPETAAFLR